jgi:xanthine/uracil permease
MVICFLFSIISVKDGWSNAEQKIEFENKKLSWIYFLLFVGVFLSFIEIYMFYEETVLNRGTIASAIGAVAAYTIFDSVRKYLYKKG